MTLEARDELRFGFVEMLFALTAAEIALQAADVVKNFETDLVALPAYTHLMFATILVATSWVGWLKSKAPGNRAPLDSVFSAAFIVLLVDVFLVICYFIVVKGVDIQRVGDTIIRIVPSSANETFWSMIIFCVYFLWDILTKAVIVPADERNKRIWRRLIGKNLWDRAWITTVCLLIAFALWLTTRTFTNAFSVVAVDVALVALVLLFRALKENSRKWASAMAVLLIAMTIAGLKLQP